MFKGRGNSAFEMGQLMYGATNMVHMVSRSRLRNAYSTHYVGDVRFNYFKLKILLK